MSKECLEFYKEHDPEFAKNLEARIAYSNVKHSKKDEKKAIKKVTFVISTLLKLLIF